MGKIKRLEKIVDNLWELEKKINTLVINLQSIRDNDLFALRTEIKQTIEDEQRIFSSYREFAAWSQKDK